MRSFNRYYIFNKWSGNFTYKNAEFRSITCQISRTKILEVTEIVHERKVKPSLATYDENFEKANYDVYHLFTENYVNFVYTIHCAIKGCIVKTELFQNKSDLTISISNIFQSFSL